MQHVCTACSDCCSCAAFGQSLYCVTCARPDTTRSPLHRAAPAGERAADRAGMHAQEKQPLGLPDRVVKITGTPDQLLRAVALLLTKLVESPNYTRFTTSNVSYGPPLAPVRTSCV